MKPYYFDTSALAKRYVEEIGSKWVRDFFPPRAAHVAMISQLLIVETFSAFHRRRREGGITEQDFAVLDAAFRGDCHSDYQILPVSEAVLNLAPRILRDHPLRTLDALHLATAILAVQIR